MPSSYEVRSCAVKEPTSPSPYNQSPGSLAPTGWHGCLPASRGNPGRPWLSETPSSADPPPSRRQVAKSMRLFRYLRKIPEHVENCTLRHGAGQSESRRSTSVCVDGGALMENFGDVAQLRILFSTFDERLRALSRIPMGLHIKIQDDGESRVVRCRYPGVSRHGQ